MEKQSDVIVKMQEKLDEFSKNCDLTSTNLEKTKLENKKLKEELNNQNAKFQDMFDILQQEDKDILCSLVKQKVDIDSHQEALKRVMELLCEEGNKNINLSNNFTNFSKNVDGKVDELNFNIEQVSSMQVHTTKSFSDLFPKSYISVKNRGVNGLSEIQSQWYEYKAGNWIG